MDSNNFATTTRESNKKKKNIFFFESGNFNATYTNSTTTNLRNTLVSENIRALIDMLQWHLQESKKKKS